MTPADLSAIRLTAELAEAKARESELFDVLRVVVTQAAAEGRL